MSRSRPRTCVCLHAQVYGFSSLKKMSSVLVRHKEKLRLYNKGAAEWVLRRCTHLYDEYGNVVEMTPQRQEELLDIVTEMAKRGLRCICLSHTDYDLVDGERPSNFFREAEEVDKNLIAMAIVGIKDPVRKEVPEAVRVCQRAGILVRMVTGDNIHTAQCIARECGILGEGHIALEGPSFRAMSHMELIPLLPRLRVRGFGIQGLGGSGWVGQGSEIKVGDIGAQARVQGWRLVGSNQTHPSWYAIEPH